MKFASHSICIRFAAAAAMVISFATSAGADEVLRYRAKPVGNTVRIDGSANVHNWDMEGTLIGGFLEIPSTVLLDSTQGDVAGAGDGKIAAKAEVSIPVNSVKNSDYDGMNEVMLQAMNAKDYPRIVFALSELTFKKPHAPNTPIEADSKGTLSINGITNAIAFPVKIESVDKTKLKISATDILVKMTDFKVPPPVKLGIFTTKPEVKIKFEWVVGLPAKAAETK